MRVSDDRPAASRVELSPDDLSPEALRRLVEEFVTRDGTDYSAVERRAEEKIAQVLAQPRSGEAHAIIRSSRSRRSHSTKPRRTTNAATTPSSFARRDPTMWREEWSRPRTYVGLLKLLATIGGADCQ